MATDPGFSSTAVRTLAGLTPATADTSLTAPTNATNLGAAGSAGTKIERITFQPVITIASAGIVNVFLHDGTTYHLRDWVYINPVTVSTTVQAPLTERAYLDLAVPTGWSFRVTGTVAALQSAVKVIAFGGDL